MTLTLTIRNVGSLDNGMPTDFVLNRRGAVIGRAATCDWSLPDPQRYISSRHCEINFRNDSYWLIDVSTNGTFLNGSSERLQGERRLEAGDVFLIGHYEVVAEFSGSALAPERETPARSVQGSDWDVWEGSRQERPLAAPACGSDWGSPPLQGIAPTSAASAAQPPQEPPPGDSRFRWGEPPTADAPSTPSSAWDPTNNSFDMPHGRSVWQAEEAAPDPASKWSSPLPDHPPPPAPDDVWGQIAEGNVVDWARGGFGQPQEQISNSLGLDQPQSAVLAIGQAPAAAPERPSSPRAPGIPRRSFPASRAEPATRQTAADPDQLAAQFLAAAGLSREEVKGSPVEVLRRGGALLRRLVAGLVLLVEARARAKAQMGAESTRFEFDGNNPIKFAQEPQQALARLLNPKEKGFMDAERAAEDAFYDLQSHQMATLKAMQGALRATLDRFAPDAIRNRAASTGLLAKIVPAARDAALWRAYERDFSGVARGSDEAFMDVFAKEFRKAYEELSRTRR